MTFFKIINTFTKITAWCANVCYRSALLCCPKCRFFSPNISIKLRPDDYKAEQCACRRREASASTAEHKTSLVESVRSGC